MNERNVIPAAGLVVIDPANGQPLPAEGKTVRGHDDYWIRRLRDGDVVQRVDDDARAAAKKQRQYDPADRGNRS